MLEASILLAIRDNDIRYDFHRDSSRFAFVDQLQKGDRVLVEVGSLRVVDDLSLLLTRKVMQFKIMETSPDDWPGVGYNRRRMYVPGWIEWIGEAYPHEGTKFGVRLQCLYLSMPNCCGLCNGDRIVWFDRDAIPRHGTVKWTGRLKGHSNIYVGVDFDEEIGGGTGRYQGLELFRTALNHAGLLPLSACMKESDMPADNAINSPPPLSPFGCSDNKSSDHQTDIRNRSDDYDSIRISNDAPLKYFGVDYDNTPININNNNINDVSQPQFTVGKIVRLLQLFFFFFMNSCWVFAGSCVDVDYRNERRFGVVKWIGYLSDVDERNNVKSVAVEIEGSIPNGWPLDIDLESSFNSLTKMYDHSSGPVTIVPISSLQPDNRFATPIVSDNINDDNCDPHLNGSKFGTLDGGVELNPCQPTRNIESLIGRMKGIQGYRNSCYLDATLYAMFAQSSAFDSILESRDTITDHSRRELVRILATEIVYPLRKFHFVRADHIYKLRQLLEKLLPEMSGLTSDEKDPEEVLIALFDKVLQVKPFLQLRNINDGSTDPAYICPLITEDLWSGEQRLLITVQSIVERSLFASNIQFAKDPKVLILQLPRYGRQKVFDKIIPQQELDITHLVFDSHLGYDHQPQPIKRSSSYNSNANRSSQNPNADQRHATLTSSITSTLTSSLTTRRSSIIPSRKLQLSAVLCIEMSHYVTFIRTNTLNKWLMFDSMADRVGLSDGYNVPEVYVVLKVKQCNKMSQWLSESGIAKIRSSLEKDSRLPTEVESDMQMNRFISDCYVCIYTYDEQQQQSDKKIDPMALAARLFAKNQFDA
ncbi:unnamed protein product [Anisakis simplex]|uniref:ubiquitinyl hydrolase 1 n=1 Tax=Anisakis simplex TaxID=6269 RepID=A0A0M3K0T6_ANISI|nr:unnamed protein product [Anisakis simplex]